MRVVWQLPTVVVVGIIGGQWVMGFEDDPWPTLGIGLLTAVASLLVYRWVVGAGVSAARSPRSRSKGSAPGSAGGR